MFLIRIIICTLYFVSCNQIEDQKEDILAQVENDIIKPIDFLFQYSNFLEKSGLNDNVLFRNKFLDQEINRLIILSLEDSIEFNQSLVLSQKIQNIKNQKILDEYFKREVLSTYQPEDSILRDAFIRSKTDLHARHLYSRSLEGANRLKAKLERGIDFEKIAQYTFRDSILAENGGDLGYFSFGDMDPAFEDAAFSLNDGEISNPIKTDFGYSIIQVLDRWTQPLIAENEFQLRKNKLISILRKRNRKEIKKSYTASLEKKLNITISDELLDQLFVNYEIILAGKEYKFENIWLSSSVGKWDIYDLSDRIRNLSSLQKESIKKKYDLLEALKGIVIREKILSLAKDQDWFYQNNFQKQLVRIGEDKIIDYIVNELFLNKNKNFQENYKSIIDSFKKKVTIYINKNLIKDLKL